MQAEHGARSTRGVVQTGRTEIPYTCTGAGPAVLLLARTPETALRVALALRFRVIEPRLPFALAQTSIEEWLRTLIDGLGLAGPHAIIAGDAADDLAATVRADADRFGKVETIRGAASAEEIATLLASLGGTTSRPPRV